MSAPAIPAFDAAITLVLAFVPAALFYAVTAHVAARYVLGEPPLQIALLVGVVAATATLALSRFVAPVLVTGSVLADLVAIRLLYDVETRIALLLTAAHALLSVAFGVVAFNVAVTVGLLG